MNLAIVMLALALAASLAANVVIVVSLAQNQRPPETQMVADLAHNMIVAYERGLNAQRDGLWTLTREYRRPHEDVLPPEDGQQDDEPVEVGKF